MHILVTLSTLDKKALSQKFSKFKILNEMKPSHHFDFVGVPDEYGSAKGFDQIEDGGRLRKEAHLFASGMDITTFGSAFEFNQEQNNTAEDVNLFSKYHKAFKDFGCLNDLYFDIVHPNSQSCNQGEIKKLLTSENAVLSQPKRERSYASHNILRNYRNRFRRLKVEAKKVPSCEKSDCIDARGQKLSADAIIKLAAEKYIQGSSQVGGESSALCRPYASAFLGLTEEDNKDVQLVQYLLSSAENIGQKQFDRARKFLRQCDELSSDKGNPIQRLGYYFSGALHERIDRETGTVTPRGLGKKQSLDIEESLSSPKPDIFALREMVPFFQVCQFAGIQAMLDHVAEAKKIHIIDLEIRLGIHNTILIHALATRYQCPVEHLKITAVGTKARTKLEETGRRLTSFAQSLNLQFSFNTVAVADILNLNENLFELNAEEAVAVYAEYSLMFMLARPDRLEYLMKVIKAINPCIIIVAEVEGNHNCPVFVNRFIEALFHYGAYFECLGDCLKHDEANRTFTEALYFSQVIRTIVAAEGEERVVRHVKINVWRAFFKRFRLVEVELSASSLYQADLMLKNFACGSSCTFDNDGKCLILGWKGRPLYSLSAWKFQ